MRFLQVFGLSTVLLLVIIVASLATPVPVHRALSAYFPVASLRSVPDADEDADGWYSRSLAHMRVASEDGRSSQPSLWLAAPGHDDPEYRAIFSYDHEYVMAVRVFKRSGRFYVEANELDFRPGGHNRAVYRPITNDEWTSVSRGLAAANIWSSTPAPPARSGNCPDFVFEARHGDEYRIISMACPDKDTQRYLPLQHAFQQIAGWFAY